MKERCHNPNNPYYHIYGGAGVTIGEDFQDYNVFANWFIAQCNLLGEDPHNTTYQVDKDQRAIPGQPKCYTAELCVLIPRERNGITNYHGADYWKFLNPKGEEIHIDNLSKFCRDNKLDSSSMAKVFYGKSGTHKGYTRLAN